MEKNVIKVLAAGISLRVQAGEEALNRGEKVFVVKLNPLASDIRVGEVVKIEEYPVTNPREKAIVEEKNARVVTINLYEPVEPGVHGCVFVLTSDDNEYPVLVQFPNMQAIYSTKHLERSVPEGNYSRSGPSVSDLGRGLTDEARMKLFQEQNPHLKEEQTLEEIVVKIFEQRLQGQIISKEEAEVRRRNHPSGSVISHTFWIGDVKRWYFFSDDHCFGLDMLEGVVPCSSYLPCKIVAREGFEDGLIKTVDEMIRLHHSDDTYISSIEELVAVLVKYPEFMHKKLVQRIAESM